MNDLESGIIGYDHATGSYTRDTVNEGLPSNTISWIVYDIEDMIWITTNAGLCKFNIHTKKFINYSGS